jgi:diguanylate cyclase (GGDEF)-like protein/PAS domain S-box-containing protein
MSADTNPTSASSFPTGQVGVGNAFPGTATPASQPTSVTDSVTPVSQSSESVAAADESRLSDHDLKLINAKLGLVNGLFIALRAKHAPTAAHSYRVGIGLSHWGLSIGMPKKDLELIEITGLLHDVGKISIPDRILQKPRRLTSDEQSVVDLHPLVGAEMLRASGASESLLSIIGCMRMTYGELCKTNASPVVQLGAQLLAIFDAFDSMTTDQVYRPALGRERALSELFKYSGTQFNPKLVRSFAESMMRSTTDHDARVKERWIAQVKSTKSGLFNYDSNAGLISPPRGDKDPSLAALLQSRLLDTMCEGVIFVDISGRILEWSKGTETLTGLARSSVIEQEWRPELLQMRDDASRFIDLDSCPIKLACEQGVQKNRRLLVQHRDGRKRPVDACILPIYDENRNLRGGAMLLKDASDQVDLEERVNNLNERVTLDALTQVHNREELNRRLPDFVETHLASKQAGSMIICDIDHFKKINDTYGHPAGDEALIVFASILEQMSRESDLVVRYGGEEFVILCDGCDLALASEKAEAIRAELSVRPLPSLRSCCIRASFGVTEVQPGDNHETFLARADRALLIAKENGRNRVVEIGGHQDIEKEQPQTMLDGWFRWLGLGSGKAILENELLTTVPHDLAVEKLRGFISDHKAEIVSTEDDRVVLRIDSRNSQIQQRVGDRPASFFLSAELCEVKFLVGEDTTSAQLRTLIEMQIRPVRDRDRRTQSLVAQAEQLRNSFQSYLGAQRLTSQTRTQLVDALTRKPLADRPPTSPPADPPASPPAGHTTDPQEPMPSEK